VKVYVVTEVLDWYPKLVSIHETRESAERAKVAEDAKLDGYEHGHDVEEWEVES
jgi:hypothetical protein